MVVAKLDHLPLRNGIVGIQVELVDLLAVRAVGFDIRGTCYIAGAVNKTRIRRPAQHRRIPQSICGSRGSAAYGLSGLAERIVVDRSAIVATVKFVVCGKIPILDRS